VLSDETKTDAFSEFVSSTEASLRYALTAAVGAEYGRDAAAEALAYGWEHWDRLRHLENPAGYLYRVGLNYGRRLRSRRRVGLPEIPTPIPWVEPGLPAALSKLSERQRATVHLVYGYEWSTAEVAALLGVSKGTAQRHLERAMAKLRHELGVEQ
jgi:DNA-directed RNA polymerase specialized sigma24 family protein